jgi:hypothetical protein
MTGVRSPEVQLGERQGGPPRGPRRRDRDPGAAYRKAQGYDRELPQVHVGIADRDRRWRPFARSNALRRYPLRSRHNGSGGRGVSRGHRRVGFKPQYLKGSDEGVDRSGGRAAKRDRNDQFTCNVIGEVRSDHLQYRRCRTVGSLSRCQERLQTAGFLPFPRSWPLPDAWPNTTYDTLFRLLPLEAGRTRRAAQGHQAAPRVAAFDQSGSQQAGRESWRRRKQWRELLSS